MCASAAPRVGSTWCCPERLWAKPLEGCSTHCRAPRSRAPRPSSWGGISSCSFDSARRRETSLPTLRIFTGFETARQLHRTVLELSRPEARTTRRALDGLAEIRPEAVSGCALRFDAALREGLEPTDLARALTPSADFVDPVLRAALRRLAELSADGELRLSDGTRLHPDVPLEFEAALGQAHEVEGFLALLRALAAQMAPAEEQTQVLRGLVAPELDQGSFEERTANAERSEQECKAGVARGPDSR